MKSMLKNLLVTVIGTVACISVYFVLLRPALLNTTNLNSQLMDKQNQVSNLQQQILAYQTAKSDLSHATDKMKITGAILDKENLVQVIQRMEFDANSTNSDETLSITVDPFIKKTPASADSSAGPLITGLKGITEVPYRITTLGSYSGLTDLFSYLEHLPNFTEVSKFEISADVAAGSTPEASVHTGKVAGSIDGVFFVNTPPGTVVAPAAVNTPIPTTNETDQ